MRSLPAPPASNHPVDVGTRTEGAILGRLVTLGYPVLLPFGVNQRYDLVVDMDGRFLRAQCKTGRLRNGCVVFSAQSIRSNTRKTICRDYLEDVELFLVFCPETGGVYAIPIEEATRSHGTLRIESTANGQGKRIRWARDYEPPE